MANLRPGARVNAEELLPGRNNSAWGLLGGGYGALWLVAGGALLTGRPWLRRDPALGFLLLAVLGGLLVYLAICVLRPFYSVERYLLHRAPVALPAAARSGRKAREVSETSRV